MAIPFGPPVRLHDARRPKLELGPLCPLVFSLTGLLVDITALVSRGSGPPASVEFALIAAAPALAAIAAISYAGDDVRIGDRNRRGRN